MPTVDESFDEVRGRLRQRARLQERGAEPIYYLVFPPAEMIAVKRLVPVWKARLEMHDGWRVHVLSLASKIQEFLRGHKHLPLWIEYEQSHPGDYEKVRGTLVAQLADSGRVAAWVEEALAAAAGTERGLLLLTDIEAIHPFLRIGAVEQKLQGRCPAPLVILYPGVRAGNTVLRFLGEYPEDGNYRSVMVGG